MPIITNQMHQKDMIDCTYKSTACDRPHAKLQVWSRVWHAVTPSAHFQMVISHSFLISIELLTSRWKAIEPNFYLQLESSQNIKLLWDIIFWSRPLCTNTYKQMELLLWTNEVTLTSKCSYFCEPLGLLIWLNEVTRMIYWSYLYKIMR